MLCFSNLKKSLLYSLLFSFFVLLFSLAVNVADTFALEDIVYTSGSQGVSVCNDCYSRGYRYVIVEITQYYSSNQYISVAINFPAPYQGLYNYNRFGSVGISIFTLHDTASVGSISFQNSAVGTVTISDHLPASLVPSTPSGNIDITENGTYDVTNYATATVNIENEIIYGDYHNDLININNSILICGAICLVLYFFYSIYRMIIKSAGGN